MAPTISSARVLRVGPGMDSTISWTHLDSVAGKSVSGCGSMAPSGVWSGTRNMGADPSGTAGSMGARSARRHRPVDIAQIVGRLIAGRLRPWAQRLEQDPRLGQVGQAEPLREAAPNRSQ